MSLVLGFVGWPCAGKDVAADYLEGVHGAQRFGHSGFIRELATSLGIQIKRTEQLSALFEARASAEDYGWIANLVTARVLKVWSRDPRKLIVVTGVRNLAEVKVYRHFPGFRLVKLEANFETRYQRWCDRPRSDGVDRTRENFRAIEALPGNANIPELMVLPGKTINNEGTLDAFHVALDQVVRRKVSITWREGSA